MKRELVLLLVLIVVLITVLARDCTKAIYTVRQALEREYPGATSRNGHLVIAYFSCDLI
jgi:hypothetical protein